MESEVVSPNLKMNHAQFLDYTATEFGKLALLQKETSKLTIKADESELNNVTKKFEEVVSREKARVDSNLLQLTSIFTKMVHETRNKVFKHLDDQLIIFRDNVEFLRERLTHFHQDSPKIPDFDKEELLNRVNQAPEAKRSEIIEDKLNQVYEAKRVFEANQREQRHYSSLVEKVRTAPLILQKRSDESYLDLNHRFEATLRNLVDEYKPRGLKSFRLKQSPTSHLTVEYRDYFKPNTIPVVHYFDPETKHLHLTSLSKNEMGFLNIKPRKIVLDTEFLIPAYHGSIVTPEGRIFLMGGIEVLGDNASNNRSYEYEERTISLHRKANMNNERFGFAITYSRNKIYVFGGIGKAGPLSSCEVYDIFMNNWTLLPNMKEASVHASVCNFKDRFIYKFGGYLGDQAQNRSIERYSIIDRTWSSVNVNWDLLYPLCGCAQINSNEIIVFGGLKEDRKGVDQSFVLSVNPYWANDRREASEAVTSLGKVNLPFADGFWTPQTILHENGLYVLQNVTVQGNVTGRRLLEYKNGKWNVVQTL